MLFEGLELETDIVDLGEADPAWSRIYSPRYSDATVGKYVHGQFLEDAAVYLERYQATAYWMSLLKEAQRHFTLESAGRPPRILDLGSGGGNTVLPLLELYPDATLVASDLSLPLLRALRATLDERYAARRVMVLQQNAERLLFVDGQFDLVCGGAILHHLRDPGRTIAECARVLRPGGVALFFEPFLAGNRIVAALFSTLLALDGGRALKLPRSLPRAIERHLRAAAGPGPGAARLASKVVAPLEGFCRDIAIRSRMNWMTVRLRRLDDKWLFERRVLERFARRAGLESPVLFPLGDSAARFAGHARAIVRLLGGDPCDAFPPWAAEIVDGIDACLAQEEMRDMLIEAGIVFVKR